MIYVPLIEVRSPPLSINADTRVNPLKPNLMLYQYLSLSSGHLTILPALYVFFIVTHLTCMPEFSEH